MLHQIFPCVIGVKIALKILPARLIFIYIWLHWGKPGSLLKPVVQTISSVKSNLFTFGLVCYFCPSSQKINILNANYKRIFNAQAVCAVKLYYRGLKLNISTAHSLNNKRAHGPQYDVKSVKCRSTISMILRQQKHIKRSKCLRPLFYNFLTQIMDLRSERNNFTFLKFF